ncbi:hypothetical protein [Paenibacillus pabuli]|uniref:hypothetical protein n=1 Tax=Paenibacillus pabuli TaxID=1472 RepID=UPI001FFED317|nr:hypothetical protein [Paenibacillus pabuli]UPK43756.1 hypothetical protein KET34_32735 [Paenibacillus pabuli]
MRKIWFVLLALFVAFPASSTSTYANSVKAKTEASVTKSNVTVNGKTIRLSGFNIAGSNYYSLRDISKHLSGTTSEFDVTWNTRTNSIEIVKEQSYTPDDSIKQTSYSSNKSYTAILSNAKVIVNGAPQQLKAYNIDGSNYFQLRDLAVQIPFEVEFDETSNQINIFSKAVENTYRANVTTTINDNVVSSEFPRWKSPILSYLINNGDQTVSVVEANQGVTIETYNTKFELIDNHKVELELPLFGGFYSGKIYNYIAFGQENKEENDDKEVIRIVRYDKNFKRIDSVSIKGGESYTINPFASGSGRMAEQDNTLIFHTARKRYTTSDGLNHQSQLTIQVNTSTMTVTNDLGRFQKNHVSHSFDQYVQFDGSTPVLVDHGDAYPRSVVIHRGSGSDYTEADAFKIPGRIGANMTGVSLGGFEMSNDYYIVAMNSIDHSYVTDYTSYEMVGLPRDQRDIILSLMPKANFNSAAAKQVTLSKYVGSDHIASIPKLIKRSDNNMIVLWQEFDVNNHLQDAKYVEIDGQGNTLGEIQSLPHYVLSETDPIVTDNRIIWYTNVDGKRTFYTIPLH